MARRVLLGAFPDGAHGLRISKPGYDVFSNPVDNEQLQFNSDWAATYPCVACGQISAGGGGSGTVGIPAVGYMSWAMIAITPTTYPSNMQGYAPLYFTGVWYNYNYSYAPVANQSYIRIVANNGSITWAYQLYQASGNTFGWPYGFLINWAIFRRQAF